MRRVSRPRLCVVAILTGLSAPCGVSAETALARDEAELLIGFEAPLPQTALAQSYGAMRFNRVVIASSPQAASPKTPILPNLPGVAPAREAAAKAVVNDVVPLVLTNLLSAGRSQTLGPDVNLGLAPEIFSLGLPDRP